MSDLHLIRTRRVEVQREIKQHEEHITVLRQELDDLALAERVLARLTGDLPVKVGFATVDSFSRTMATDDVLDSEGRGVQIEVEILPEFHARLTADKLLQAALSQLLLEVRTSTKGVIDPHPKYKTPSINK